LNSHDIIAMAPPQGGSGGGGFMGTIIMFALIILIFYFMILRPQQKRQKSRQLLLDSVKKGDKVVTVGGMHGTVLGVEDKSILVQIADNVKVKFERSAISSIAREGEPETKVG
jgi:preprotein translocase subunit YajC